MAVNKISDEKLSLQAFSGGGLPSALGDLLVDAGVHLISIYGGTEFGPVSRVFRRNGDERDWQYIEFTDAVKIRWDPQGDGIFEAQYLVRFFPSPYL